MTSATPQPLIFPPSIRFATPDELPSGDRAAAERIANARITTGFVTRSVDASRDRVFAEANVHAPDSWLVFDRLVRALLPEKAALLIAVDDGRELTRCHYTMRDELLSALAEYAIPLASDCFLEFGIIFQSGDVTEEVFVTPAKNFKIWTKQEDVLTSTFAELNIPRVESLQFIDEYPRTTSALHHAGIGDFAALVAAVVSRCATLPSADTSIPLEDR